MTAHALQLPCHSAHQAAALRCLGRGLRLPFRVADEVGELLLEPGAGPTGGTPACLQSAHGVLRLSEPGAVLSLFGECPVSLPTEPGRDDDWFWSLFHEAMSPQLRSLFGHLAPLAEDRLPGLACRLSLSLGAARVVCRLELEPQTLLALAAGAPWQPLVAPLAPDWPLRLPLLLGHLQLPAGQLRRLRAGDVLLPESPLFDPDGQGELRLGRHRLAVRLESLSLSLQLTVLALEENAMDEDYAQDPAADGWDASPYDTPGYPEQPQAYAETYAETYAEESAAPADDPTEPFDELPLALTLRCGQLRLSLGELRRLAPGTLLEVGGVAPGMASLYYGERPVAHGELVEIEGRLGLQLTRVDFAG